MTPTETHEYTLSQSRERLARAISKFERLARDAAETIAGLRHEKAGAEKRLADLTALFSQERSNFEQRAALVDSVKTESEERAKSSEQLNTRLEEQERLMNEQLQTISQLESALETSSRELKERAELEAAWKSEMEEWTGKVARLEEATRKNPQRARHHEGADVRPRAAGCPVRLAPDTRRNAKGPRRQSTH